MNSLFPSTSLFLFKEPAREACCQRSHKEGFVPVFSWMFGTGLCRLGNGWSCAPGASSRRKRAEKFSNSQQAAGFFPLDWGICWSCQRQMQDPVTVPGVKSSMMLLNTNLTHKQVLELFLLLREPWAVLFLLFRQNPCPRLGSLCLQEERALAGQSQSPGIPSQCYIRAGDACPLGITTFPGLPFPGEGI